MEGIINLASPWIRYAQRVEALFWQDEDVTVAYDDTDTSLNVYVDGSDKAEAIAALLPGKKEYGNVTLTVNVVPSNDEPTEADLFRRAFAGNAALVDVAEGFGPAGDITYALFAPETVQLKEDDVSQFYGLTTLTLAQLAESVLDAKEVCVSSARIMGEDD